MTSEAPGSASALLRSPWTHAALLATGTLGAWLSLGIGEAPMAWDPAYFTYMGQALLRGEPIYSHTFMAYPPVEPLVLAGSMAVAGWLDVPSYLAPRYAAVACGVASVVLVYVIARRATGDAMAGLVAGLCLAGFHWLAESSLATLEPKHLVILLTLAAAAACQRQHWRLAGCAAALAATSYQPAILTPLAIGALAWQTDRRHADGSRLAFALGLAVGLLPTLGYLAATGGWTDFWVRAVLLPAAARLPTAGEAPVHWIGVLRLWYASELPCFVAAAIGWLSYAATSLRPGRDRLDAWLGVQTAGIPLLTVCYVAAATIDFQGYPDAYLLLPLVAFWVAWLAQRMTQLAVTTLRPGAAHEPTLRAGLGVVWIALVAWVGFRDLPREPRVLGLSQQRAEVRRIVEPAEGEVLALFAEEVYVLSERSPPRAFPFLRLPRIFVPFLPHAGYRDCREVARRVLAERPAVAVLRIMPFAGGGCEPVIGQALTKAGYRLERSDSELRVYRPAGAEPRP